MVRPVAVMVVGNGMRKIIAIVLLVTLGKGPRA
jgi:hypothetical protein